MSYSTIYRTARQNQIILLKGILEQNNIDYRILKASNPAGFPSEVKVQVKNSDESRALTLLKENGFLSDSADSPGSVSMARFWLWLVIALLAIITASFFINFFLNP